MSQNNNNKYKTTQKSSNNYPNKKNKEKTKMVGSLAMMGIASLSTFGFEAASYLGAKADQIKAESSISAPVEEEYTTLDDFKIEYLKENATDVTANEILNDYWEATTADEFNKVQEEYANKFLEVTGEVQKVVDDSLEGSYILLENSETKGQYNDYMTVQCLVTDAKEIEEMNKIVAGDTITVNGFSKGSEVVCVSIYNCDIKEIER